MHDPWQSALRAALVLLLGALGPGCRAGEATSPTQAVTTGSSTVAAAPAGGGTSAGVLPAGGGAVGGVGDANGCGYQLAGQPLHVAEGIDLCIAPAVCTSENCPPPLGDCVSGRCVYKAGYKGMATLPEAWVTYYCELSGGGCNGIGQTQPPLTTATRLGTLFGMPLCDHAGGVGPCVGIAAAPAMLVGNSQVAIDSATGMPVKPWGLGVSEASGVCYSLTGIGGRVVVALTDRCGGYCTCNGSGKQECGPCVSAANMAPNCPCVGTAPPQYTDCCGATCAKLDSACDWCASNNHPHFDLDTATFKVVCGANAVQGSCKLSSVVPVACPLDVAWPPP